MTRRPPRTFFIGNCQANSLANVWNEHLLPLLGEEAEYLDGTRPEAKRRAGSITAQDRVAYQINLDRQYPFTREDIPAGAAVTPFPDVRGSFLWPHGSVPRVDNPRKPFRATGPYHPEVGDRILNGYITDKLAPEEGLARYRDLDVPKATHLGRMAELLADQQKAKEAETDIKVADFIGAQFRAQRLFITPGHLDVPLFRVLASQIFRALGVSPVLVHGALARVTGPPFESRNEAPLHPSVARHYGLAWWTEDRRYHHISEGAFTWEERVLRYMRGDWSPALHEGLAMLRRGRNDNTERALELLREGLALAPRSARGYQWLGYGLHRLDRRDEAFAAFERAAELGPDFADHAMDFSRALRRRGRNEEALAAARRAVAIDGQNALAHETLAAALEALGRAAEAAEPAARAAELSGGSPHGYGFHAQYLLRQEDIAGAEHAIRTAIALAPDAKPYRRILAAVLRGQGRAEEAAAVVAPLAAARAAANPKRQPGRAPTQSPAA